MKRILLGICTMALLFTACPDGNDDPDVPTNGNNPVSALFVSPQELELDMIQDTTDSLTAVVLPSGANQNVTWNVPVNTIITHQINGNTLQVTAAGVGEVTVSATSVGQGANGQPLTQTAKIIVHAQPVAKSLHWDLNPTNLDIPGGWNWDDLARHPDFDIGNGLTLLGTTGSEQMANDRGSQHRMRAYDNNIPGWGSAPLFSRGSIRMHGGGTWGIITGHQGPFELTITWSNTSGGQPRWPVVKIGEMSYNLDGSLSNGEGSESDWVNPGVLTVTYTGTDTPDVLLRANSGIYVFDVYLEPSDITEIPVTEVTIGRPHMYTLGAGDTLQLEATVLPPHATVSGVTWSSSNNFAATVDEDGLVTAVAQGQATIAATSNGNKEDGTKAVASTVVEVVDAIVPVVGVSLNEITYTMAKGDTFQLVATLDPLEATEQGLTWSSSHPAVVAVDEDGLITASVAGTATITVTTVGLKDDGTSAVATAVITVTDTGPRQVLHWNFQTSPAGWSPGDVTPDQPTDAVYGNGMTLLGRTGTNVSQLQQIIENDFGTGSQMAVNAGATVNDWIDDFDPPFTPGLIRINRGTFAKIEGAQGPYTITINFTAGGGTDDPRFPFVKIGDTHYNHVPGAQGHVFAYGGAQNPPRSNQLNVQYDGTDRPLILLKISGGTRVWDVIITPIDN